MKANLRRFAAVTACALLGTIVAACETPYTPPKQVDATNPTVTYRYRSDNQLMEANDRAAEYCAQYHAVPQSVDFGQDPDGARYVVFECLSGAPVGGPRSRFDPNLTYTVGSDRELMDATRDAQMYCRDTTGSSRVISSLSNGPGGTKTVRFQCRPR